MKYYYYVKDTEVKWKHRELINPAPGHSATKWQRPNSNPGNLALVLRTETGSGVCSYVFNSKKRKKRKTFERWSILRLLSKGNKSWIMRRHELIHPASTSNTLPTLRGSSCLLSCHTYLPLLTVGQIISSMNKGLVKKIILSTYC